MRRIIEDIDVTRSVLGMEKGGQFIGDRELSDKMNLFGEALAEAYGLQGYEIVKIKMTIGGEETSRHKGLVRVHQLIRDDLEASK